MRGWLILIDEERRIRVKTNEGMSDYDRRYESNLSNAELLQSLLVAAIVVVGLVSLVFWAST